MSEKSAAVQTARTPASLRVVEPQTMFERMGKFYEAIARRAFERFESRGRSCGHELEDWFKAEAEFLHPVHVHIEQTGGAFSVRAEVPGFSGKDLAASIEPRRVIISGKRESKENRKKGETVYTEHCSDELLRVIELPAEVNVSGATATLSNGVLEIELPKAGKLPAVRVEPKAT
jgi:HSP20 family molecular chaperone IbpA